MSQKKGSFNNLDFNNIGSWPKQAKAVFCVLLALLIVVLSYLVVVRGMTEELDIGHYFRRLTLFCNLFGSADHHLQRFAALAAVAPNSPPPR